MEHLSCSIRDRVAWVVLSRGKVNALNDQVLDELGECFTRLAAEDAASAVVLTGKGSFFSFGFDVPAHYGLSKDEFVRWLGKFTGLYRQMFSFPKPLVAALNGHTIAGGCMLALACDYRLMASGKAKISLNEIAIGASVFAGVIEMLRLAVGPKNAQEILYSGAMYTAEQALALGLADRVLPPERLAEEAHGLATALASRDAVAFASMKRLMRRDALSVMETRETDSILAFADIWYSESTREKLRRITIR